MVVLAHFHYFSRAIHASIDLCNYSSSLSKQLFWQPLPHPTLYNWNSQSEMNWKRKQDLTVLCLQNAIMDFLDHDWKLEKKRKRSRCQASPTESPYKIRVSPQFRNWYFFSDFFCLFNQPKTKESLKCSRYSISVLEKQRTKSLALSKLQAGSLHCSCPERKKSRVTR